jgi:hypothetical protein
MAGHLVLESMSTAADNRAEETVLIHLAISGDVLKSLLVYRNVSVSPTVVPAETIMAEPG